MLFFKHMQHRGQPPPSRDQGKEVYYSRAYNGVIPVAAEEGIVGVLHPWYRTLPTPAMRTVDPELTQCPRGWCATGNTFWTKSSAVSEAEDN